MAWTVEVTLEFERWWDSLTDEERISVDGMIQVLETQGPALGHPYATDVVGSTVRHLRQLFVPHPERAICVLYVPSHTANAVVLLTGTTSRTPDDVCPPAEIQRAELIFEGYVKTRNRPH